MTVKELTLDEAAEIVGGKEKLGILVGDLIHFGGYEATLPLSEGGDWRFATTGKPVIVQPSFFIPRNYQRADREFPKSLE